MDRAVERVVAESHGPRLPWRAVLVISAVAAGVVISVVLFSGDGADDAGAAPTTSMPPNVTPSVRGGVSAPVLGEETGGLSLYAAGDGVIRRIELDTGRVTTRWASDEHGEWRTIDVRPDQVRLAHPLDPARSGEGCPDGG
jgi:hypothetical protein